VNDLEALLAKVTALEGRLAAIEAPPAPVFVEPEPVKLEPKPRALFTLVGRGEGYLNPDPRVVRQIAEGIALCLGTASPTKEVPADWVAPMRRVTALRASRATWRAALEGAGLEVPEDVEEHVRALRLELDALQGRLPALAGLVLEGVNSVAEDSLRAALRRLVG
jgi:hypothetical protein